MKHPGHTYGGFVPAISEWGMTTSYSYLMDVEFTLASILEDKDLKGRYCQHKTKVIPAQNWMVEMKDTISESTLMVTSFTVGFQTMAMLLCVCRCPCAA
jgi:hypothetical protein